MPGPPRDYYRNGPSHRDGADVSFADIVKIFGFKAATIGKWVNTKEQQQAANLFFDAFCDLMQILQVPEAVISLNGTLSLAFGSGGQKHVSAHYHSRKRELALAKNAGGGALAHEWFHAFDHYICRQLYADAGPHDFASAVWLSDKPLKQHPLNQRLALFFRHLLVSADGQAQSDLLQTAIRVDRAMGMYYYAQPQEMAARVFEACIQGNALKNHFLAKGTLQSDEAKLGLYPDATQRQSLAALLLDYFYWLGQAVDNR